MGQFLSLGYNYISVLSLLSREKETEGAELLRNRDGFLGGFWALEVQLALGLVICESWLSCPSKLQYPYGDFRGWWDPLYQELLFLIMLKELINMKF